MKPHTTGTHCKVLCAGGNACICNDVATHPHTLHVCAKAGCCCHMAAYRVEVAEDGAGRRYYVPQGARLAVQRGTP